MLLFFFFLSLMNLLQYCFCFMFWFFGHEACGILAPLPGIEPTPHALEGEVLTTGPPGKSRVMLLRQILLFLINRKGNWDQERLNHRVICLISARDRNTTLFSGLSSVSVSTFHTYIFFIMKFGTRIVLISREKHGFWAFAFLYKCFMKKWGYLQNNFTVIFSVEVWRICM